MSAAEDRLTTALADRYRAADVQAGSEFRVANRRSLVRLARYGFGDVNRVDYDIHPVGKRFVLLKPKRSERQGITMVLNWLEEMKARLGSGTSER